LGSGVFESGHPAKLFNLCLAIMLFELIQTHKEGIVVSGCALACVSIAVASIQIMRHGCTHYRSSVIKSRIIYLIFFLIWCSVDAIASMIFVAARYAKEHDDGIVLHKPVAGILMMYKLLSVLHNETLKNVVGILKVCREVYEAVTVLGFVTLILACLGGVDRVIGKIEEEWRTQRPHHPRICGGSLGQRLFCCFHWFYRPGLGMLCTILSGLVQFSFVLFSVTLVNVVVVWNDLEDDLVGSRILQGTQLLKLVSTTVAMYQIFMLHEALHENTGLKDDYSKVEPEPKFLFFKIPILATMWLDGGVKLLLKDSNEAVLIQNLVIALIMFFFAILSIRAFPPSQLTRFPIHEHVEDPRPTDSCSYTVQMLMDIRRLKQRAKKRRDCMDALVLFHQDCMLLDIDKNGVIERGEFMYLCEVAGVAGDRDAHDAMLDSMGGQLDLRSVFPGKFQSHSRRTLVPSPLAPLSAPLLSHAECPSP